MAKPQKPEQLRELKTEELEQKLAVLAEERFRLAFRRGTEAIANPLQFRAMRREIARIRGRRKVRTGVVVSDKMTKTVTVSLVRRFAHGFYGKQVVRTKQVAAHNDKGAKAGDTVRIVETRPLSKTKRWRVVEVLERAR